VRPDGKTLIAQPHMSFEEKDMWTLDHVRGNTIRSPLKALRELSPQARAAHIEEYRKGFKIRRI